MYYILYEGLKIESNEPVYCTYITLACEFVSTINSILGLFYIHIPAFHPYLTLLYLTITPINLFIS